MSFLWIVESFSSEEPSCLGEVTAFVKFSTRSVPAFSDSHRDRIEAGLTIPSHDGLSTTMWSANRLF